MTVPGSRPAVDQVGPHRVTDLGGQRHPIGSTGFASDPDLARSPVDVVEFQARNLIERKPSRASCINIAKSRKPLGVLRSQPPSRVSTSPRDNDGGIAVSRQPATGGIDPLNNVVVDPRR